MSPQRATKDEKLDAALKEIRSWDRTLFAQCHRVGKRLFVSVSRRTKIGGITLRHRDFRHLFGVALRKGEGVDLLVTRRNRRFLLGEAP